MTLPYDLDIEKALIFFHAYMYGPLRGKVRLYSGRAESRRGSRCRRTGSSSHRSSSVTAGCRRRAVSTSRSYEVKSSTYGSAFEYQYHRNSWRAKLDADRAAGHLFISHQDLLRLVEVRYCDGSDLREFFDAWEAKRPYSDQGQQRFRTIGAVRLGAQDNATLLLRIEDGEVTADATE